MAPRFVIGTSTKMYFSQEKTVSWCTAVSEIVRSHPATASGLVSFFVIPSYPSIPAALEITEGSGILVGAQDVATDDAGAFTGEVSGALLAELGVRMAEVGHAERRRLYGETDDVVRAKTTAALRNGLDPVLCVGEAARVDPADAAAECVRQIDDALAGARADGISGRVVVAYEPHWAIGAPEPAPEGHIIAVCTALREHVGADAAFPGSVVIYGGSAGPGLLTRIADGVDGLFLGRFAHDPAAIADILDEASALAR